MTAPFHGRDVAFPLPLIVSVPVNSSSSQTASAPQEPLFVALTLTAKGFSPGVSTPTASATGSLTKNVTATIITDIIFLIAFSIA